MVWLPASFSLNSQKKPRDEPPRGSFLTEGVRRPLMRIPLPWGSSRLSALVGSDPRSSMTILYPWRPTIRSQRPSLFFQYRSSRSDRVPVSSFSFRLTKRSSAGSKPLSYACSNQPPLVRSLTQRRSCSVSDDRVRAGPYSPGRDLEATGPCC